MDPNQEKIAKLESKIKQIEERLPGIKRALNLAYNYLQPYKDVIVVKDARDCVKWALDDLAYIENEVIHGND